MKRADKQADFLHRLWNNSQTRKRSDAFGDMLTANIVRTLLLEASKKLTETQCHYNIKTMDI